MSHGHWFLVIEAPISLQDTGDFHDALDVLLGPEFCDVVVRKMDKKKERFVNK